MHVGARAPLNLLALWRADAARADPRHPVPRCDAPQFRGVRRTPDARAGGARWARSALDRAGRAAALAADAPPPVPRAPGLSPATHVETARPAYTAAFGGAGAGGAGAC